ncbi:uncharacterized protein LOC111260809 [Varroa jacobsoni]|uniref:uncharacterized protein LOC111260809 n=1 Tax=Varroa jacobsoni TaxID=62625 RepID=UPI000BF95730|nr:uncharacterized protein LOC111260809 [Varroa jacobsoni]
MAIKIYACPHCYRLYDHYRAHLESGHLDVSSGSVKKKFHTNMDANVFVSTEWKMTAWYYFRSSNRNSGNGSGNQQWLRNQQRLYLRVASTTSSGMKASTRKERPAQLVITVRQARSSKTSDAGQDMPWKPTEPGGVCYGVV